ncbi:MAG: STAS domain-containing protein [Lachnospiraceae bacterium]|nr:STAS domain-containing protein [Lachnospiraceae bacterium]
MKNYKKEYLKKDILSGIVVALVSIPISMGYAQVAGLPVVYGLYGSVLPILIYAFITSSPQFVFGVDATPAALVGGTLISLEITPGSDEAIAIIPVITTVTACWLLLFFCLKAGKLVKYISKPVMGGFISGIGCTIILMQVPKLFGGNPGTGELFVLFYNIWNELPAFNPLSALLGIGTIIILQIAKKKAPKFPMSVLILIAGAGLTAFCHIDRYGVKLLPKVESGLPRLTVPDMSLLLPNAEEIIVLSFTIALVIMAQTLLATSNYALKYNYKINNNREVLAYAAGNAAGALVGCCPLNGSVSRSGIADQYGCKSQLMSITAALTMVLVLLFGTGLLEYLPVPVLTGIVISALMGIVEFGIARKTWEADKQEFTIFMAAFLGVLILGTIYGVVIGVILSFVAVIIRAVIPPKAFLGIIPGHEGLHNLSRNKNAYPIEHTIIYRFSGNLFFANINAFQDDIDNAVKDDTKQVIIDARGIGSIDITAAERLVILKRNLNAKGINLYLTEHAEAVNDQLRAFGASSLIEEGSVRRTVSLALRAAGINKPYPLEGISGDEEYAYEEANERLAEFEWAFGEGAGEKMEALAAEVAEKLVNSGDYSMENIIKTENTASWGRIGLFDEDELLNRLELYFSELEEKRHMHVDEIEQKLEQRRHIIEEKLRELSPEALELLRRHRRQIEEHLKEKRPEYYEHYLELRKRFEEKQ